MRNCSSLCYRLVLATAFFAPISMAHAKDLDLGTEIQDGPVTGDPVPVPVFYGSCSFQGQYASGCMEFYDGTWTDLSTQEYCQKNSKVGTTAAITQDKCVKAEYNSLCSSLAEDGSLANIYVNNLPSFICKKYMNGALTKRPASGW